MFKKASGYMLEHPFSKKGIVLPCSFEGIEDPKVQFFVTILWCGQSAGKFFTLQKSLNDYTPDSLHTHALSAFIKSKI